MFYTVDVTYNPLVDVAEVDSIGYVDLADAFANGVVPTVVGDDNLIYNNISEPTSLMDMPKDIFDAMQQNETVRSYKPEDND